MSQASAAPPPVRPQKHAPRRRRDASHMTTLFAQGEPFVWLTAGGLVIALGMIASLLWHVVATGLATFWPRPLVAIEMVSGERYLGEIADSETYAPQAQDLAGLTGDLRAAAEARLSAGGGEARRMLVRTGNYELTGVHYRWISDFAVARQELPTWGIVVERLTLGRFYGTPAAFRVDGSLVTSDPAEAWRLFEERHDAARERLEERQHIERHALGAVSQTLEEARLALRAVELEAGVDSEEWRRQKLVFDAAAAVSAEQSAELSAQVAALNAENARNELVLVTSDGAEKVFQLGEIVRAYPANQLGFLGKLGVYLSRWLEFASAEPREANSEGGIFPAIFGTVVMTLIMSIVVVPFGVLAALYLREYARQGLIVSAVRVAVNNLAGVPSIVFGVFGLGFFCYVIGASIDELLFSAKLPNPTYGKGGLLWASLTLALLTLPVVIVATEEALAAVPGSMREGSYACGATKWQTIQRIVLPRALPGIMTGMILAIARGAGEVAPLMLVGAVKLAPELPVDGVFPYVHPERSFMHLGFHIYDLGFQSQNIMAATPMVYTTTLVLIGIVVLLNLTAVWVRARLRRNFDLVQI